MKERGWGRILAVTSIAAKQPIPGLMLSNSLRAAVTGFVHSLADEVARSGVTINTILPGYTRTERVAQLNDGERAREGLEPADIQARLEQEIPDRPSRRAAGVRRPGDLPGLRARQLHHRRMPSRSTAAGSEAPSATSPNVHLKLTFRDAALSGRSAAGRSAASPAARRAPVPPQNHTAAKRPLVRPPATVVSGRTLREAALAPRGENTRSAPETRCVVEHRRPARRGSAGAGPLWFDLDTPGPFVHVPYACALCVRNAGAARCLQGAGDGRDRDPRRGRRIARRATATRSHSRASRT